MALLHREQIEIWTYMRTLQANKQIKKELPPLVYIEQFSSRNQFRQNFDHLISAIFTTQHTSRVCDLSFLLCFHFSISFSEDVCVCVRNVDLIRSFVWNRSTQSNEFVDSSIIQIIVYSTSIRYFCCCCYYYL